MGFTVTQKMKYQTAFFSFVKEGKNCTSSIMSMIHAGQSSVSRSIVRLETLQSKMEDKNKKKKKSLH